MKNRVAFLLCLDTAMLLLVCVLECINFTGLEWHQWLGFAFCPVVLLHVVMQWPWFSTQFQRVLTPGAWRVRVNAGLNLLLLVLMAAVLFSGGLVSAQGVEALGESFGLVGIWREMHGWLNFVLVVLVGLHLALNWDWVIAALRRRRPERPGLGTELASNQGAQSPHPVPMIHSRPLVQPCGPLPTQIPFAVSQTAQVPDRGGEGVTKVARSLGRTVAVLLVASLAAGAVYFTMKAMLLPEWRAKMERERVVTAAAIASEKNQPAPSSTEPALNRLLPRNRPMSLRRAPDLAGTLAITLGVAVIGRYVFRLRL